MVNHWVETKTEREVNKPLLSLIVDKAIWHGQIMGAHRNESWNTNTYYDCHYCKDQSSCTHKKSARIQGTLDRIGKVIYHQTFHVDEKMFPKVCGFNLPRLGPDIYDHSIRFEWKELFGKGRDKPIGGEGPYCSDKQDVNGKWHSPCDTGMWVTLYHPRKQAQQEAVHDCWNLKGQKPQWRPEYHYTKEQVAEALQLMCETFGWEYSEEQPGSYCIIS